MIWSKYRLSEELTDGELMDQLKKRYVHSLPLEYLDFVIVSSLEPEVEEQAEEEPKEPVSE